MNTLIACRWPRNDKARCTDYLITKLIVIMKVCSRASWHDMHASAALLEDIRKYILANPGEKDKPETVEARASY